MWTNVVTFGGENAADRLGTDWIEVFNLWDLPINFYCKTMNVYPTEKNSSGELKRTLKTIYFRMNSWID